MLGSDAKPKTQCVKCDEIWAQCILILYVFSAFWVVWVCFFWGGGGSLEIFKKSELGFKLRKVENRKFEHLFWGLGCLIINLMFQSS